MAFAQITKIENYQLYLDLAISKSKKEIDVFRHTVGARDSLSKSKKIELKRILLMKNYLSIVLKRIIKEFPSTNDLTEFYKNLMEIEIGIVNLKKSLATIDWTENKIAEFFGEYSAKIKKSRDLKRINLIRKEFLGRISSLFKRNKEVFEFLEECRRIFISFPSIKDGLYTVAISGYPNVGKSTLLSKLTTSKPKIRDYAFTTISLLTGYDSTSTHKIQFIDTPGTLNRKDAKNKIERMSYCAIKYSSDIIVFVFDPDPNHLGYDKQKRLLDDLDAYNKDTVIYISKTDILKEEAIKIEGKLKSYKIFTDYKSLLKDLQKKAKELY